MFVECITTDATMTTHVSGVGYVRVPDQQKRCVFPFQFLGKQYNSCTTYLACDSCFWCGTKFNVTATSGWGMCSNDCNKEGDKFKKIILKPSFMNIFDTLSLCTKNISYQI